MDSDDRSRIHGCDLDSDHTEKATSDGTKRVAVVSPEISLRGASLTNLPKSRKPRKSKACYTALTLAASNPEDSIENLNNALEALKEQRTLHPKAH